MKEMMKKVAYVMEGESGEGGQVSNLVMISVVLIIATAVFKLGQAAVTWLGGSTDVVSAFKTQ